MIHIFCGLTESRPISLDEDVRGRVIAKKHDVIDREIGDAAGGLDAGIVGKHIALLDAIVGSRHKKI